MNLQHVLVLFGSRCLGLLVLATRRFPKLRFVNDVAVTLAAGLGHKESRHGVNPLMLISNLVVVGKRVYGPPKI